MGNVSGRWRRDVGPKVILAVPPSEPFLFPILLIVIIPSKISLPSNFADYVKNLLKPSLQLHLH